MLQKTLIFSIIFLMASIVQAKSLTIFNGKIKEGQYKYSYPDEHAIETIEDGFKITLQSGQYAGMAIGFPSQDLSSHWNTLFLRIQMKDAEAMKEYSISLLSDGGDGKKIESSLPCSSYIKGNKILIPLSNFPQKGSYWNGKKMLPEAFDHSKIIEVKISSTPKSKISPFILEKIEIVKKKASSSQSTEKQADSKKIVLFNGTLTDGSYKYAYPDQKNIKYSKNALQLTMVPNDYSGGAFGFSKENLSSLRNSYSLRVKLKTSGKFYSAKIGLVSTAGEKKPEILLPLSSYLKDTKDTWQEISIPLSSFPSTAEFWNGSKTEKLPFHWESVAEVKFSSGKFNGTPFTLTVEKIEIIKTDKN